MMEYDGIWWNMMEYDGLWWNMMDVSEIRGFPN